MLMTDIFEPRTIVVAGDWHENLPWAVQVVKDAPGVLPGERQPLILQLGDFGIWSGSYGEYFMSELAEACRENNVKIWFIDGNHEDFPLLHKWEDGDPIRWLPRGTRWTWHDRTWLALGGAVSLDRKQRREGVSWFPEEEITDEQELAVMMDGHADVMAVHECPWRAVQHLALDVDDGTWDPEELARSFRHSQRLQRIVDQVQPRYLMHGHLHMAYRRELPFNHGLCEVTGLDMDGSRHNALILDVNTMEWGPGVKKSFKRNTPSTT